jgi:hypothetical protein
MCPANSSFFFKVLSTGFRNIVFDEHDLGNSTNNQDDKCLNSNSPKTNTTCLKKDDGLLIKKRIPI